VSSSQRGLSPVSSLTRRDAVLSELRSAILDGRIVPGDRLKEVQLAKELGVSRPTLREAIYQLIHEGLLVQEDYKGVTVAGIGETTISDIATVRVALETVAARAIATDARGHAREALQRAWLAYDDAARSGDPARENEAHVALHSTIWMASGNTMLRRIWPIVSAPINLALSADLATRHDTERNRRLHRELVEAIMNNRRREIDTAIREHIETSASELVALLRQRRELDQDSGSRA
jgi:DNA-binding GntR family transcriptional regulator